MACAICGGGAVPAGKLCGACKAALKRARHETVSQLEPRPRRAGRPRRGETSSARASAAERAPASHAKVALRPAIAAETASASAPASPIPAAASSTDRSRTDRLRLPASFVALGVVVAATGYFVSHLRGAAQAADSAAHAIAPYVPLPTADASPQPLAEPFVLPAREALPVPPKPAKSPSAVRPAKPAPAARETVAEPPPAVATVAETIAPPPAVAPKAEPPAPDRWQLLAEAIAQCGGGLGGMLCGERARWQYCDGYWGKVAQCPGAIGADFHR